jgi:hypothetical protein
MHPVKSLLARRKELVAHRKSLVEPIDAEVAAIDASLEAFNDGELPLPPQPVDPKPSGTPSTEYLLWAIRQSGGLDFSQCALDIYGEDSSHHRTCVHRTLAYLKKRGAVTRKGRRWLIAPPRGRPRKE